MKSIIMIFISWTAFALPEVCFGDDSPDRISYRLDFQWGGLSPYGSDDLNVNNNPNNTWDPVNGNAPSSLDFDDVFGQPKGHAIGVKLWRIYKDNYGLRLGYERDHYRTDFRNGPDTSIVWKVLKNDFSAEGTLGNKIGNGNVGLYPYLFAGISYVAYGESLELSVRGNPVDARNGDILANVFGLNLGGGAQLIVFKYVDIGIEIWHQWKKFALTKDPQPDGSAKELGARILVGFDYEPR